MKTAIISPKKVKIKEISKYIPKDSSLLTLGATREIGCKKYEEKAALIRNREIV